jgi:hypothetical protein
MSTLILGASQIPNTSSASYWLVAQQPAMLSDGLTPFGVRHVVELEERSLTSALTRA